MKGGGGGDERVREVKPRDPLESFLLYRFSFSLQNQWQINPFYLSTAIMTKRRSNNLLTASVSRGFILHRIIGAQKSID